MESVSIYDAKTHLSRLVARAEHGEETVITRHGRPVARIVPVPAQPSTRTPGRLRGQITVGPDFEDLSEEDARDWYGT